MLVPLDIPTRGKAWAIVVNQRNPEVRKRFTVAHELGHLIMHRFTRTHADNKFGVRFRDGRSSEGTDLEEIEANQFAAELLMPEAIVLEKVRRRGIGLDYGMDSPVAQEQLRNIAEELGVSLQALSIRLANLTAFA
jgi:Zn-dependent peptidase ImmA (M78 family)